MFVLFKIVKVSFSNFRSVSDDHKLMIWDTRSIAHNKVKQEIDILKKILFRLIPVLFGKCLNLAKETTFIIKFYN